MGFLPQVAGDPMGMNHQAPTGGRICELAADPKKEVPK